MICSGACWQDIATHGLVDDELGNTCSEVLRVPGSLVVISFGEKGGPQRESDVASTIRDSGEARPGRWALGARCITNSRSEERQIAKKADALFLSHKKRVRKNGSLRMTIPTDPRVHSRKV